MVNNRKDSCSGERVESCGGVVCACGGEVVKRCMLRAGGNTGTLEQLEHWNNRDNKKVVVDSVGKTYGGCGLCMEDVWWLWTL